MFRLGHPVREGFPLTKGMSASTALPPAPVTEMGYPQLTVASIYTSAGDSPLVPSAPPRTPTLRPGLSHPTSTTANVYTYQTSPSINKLNLEAPPDSGGSLGSRVRSAPGIYHTQSDVLFVTSKPAYTRQHMYVALTVFHVKFNFFIKQHIVLFVEFFVV